MKTVRILVMISVSIAIAQGLCDSAPAADNTIYHKPGPFRTKRMEFPDLTDSKRNNRSVPIKVVYPDAKGPLPLIVMSHGGMGTWDSLIYQAEHLASHGYVVLCPEHIFSNNIKTKEHIRTAKGTLKERINEALHQIVTDSRSVLERPRDVSFCIDQAIKWNQTHPQLKGRIATARIGTMGHSYGAYTTLAVCGARPILDHLRPPVSPGKGLSGDLGDPRVTFGFAMSPQGPDALRFSKDSYKTVNRPIICMSGTKDLHKGREAGGILPAEFRLEAFKLIPEGQKYFLWLENADHMCFTDNPKAWMFPSAPRSDAQRITKAMMVIASNMYLKDSEDAKASFNEKYANSLRGKVVTKVTWLEKSEDVDALLKNSTQYASTLHALTHDGLKRSYRVYVPVSCDKKKAMPLVIALHGGGGTGEKMEDLTLGGFNKLAEKEGFVAVYPDGIEKRWNDGRKEVNYRAHRDGIDDVGFISALIDKLARTQNIDRRRVYVTGMSNGCMMSHRLALELSGKIAAIAPVGAALPGVLSSSRPSRPVPVLMISGVKDPLVPWGGGDIHFQLWRYGRKHKCGNVLSQDDTVEFWVKHNRCSAKPIVEQLPDTAPDDGTRIRREMYAPKENGAATILYAIVDGGHTWPGGKQYLEEGIIGKTSRDMDACEVIWNFFKRQQLPE